MVMNLIQDEFLLVLFFLSKYVNKANPTWAGKPIQNFTVAGKPKKRRFREEPKEKKGFERKHGHGLNQTEKMYLGDKLGRNSRAPFKIRLSLCPYFARYLLNGFRSTPSAGLLLCRKPTP